MSKQELAVIGQDAAGACCEALASAPLDDERAVEPARVFKALSDPGERYPDRQLDDPAGQGVEAVRPIRAAIEQRVHGLPAELGIRATA